MRPLLSWVVRGLTVAAALLATSQPMLGSFAFFRRTDPLDYETIHLVFGGLLYNCALLLAILSGFTTLRRRWLLLILGVAQYVLLHVQLLLGLESNDDARLLAYHIPIGVTIFFVAWLMLALAFDMLRAPSTRDERSAPEKDLSAKRLDPPSG